MEISIFKGSKVDEKEFVVLTELLMRQLLKLDAIEADREAKVQRKNEVICSQCNLIIYAICMFFVLLVYAKTLTSWNLLDDCNDF